ncbi:hypothetical protein E2C01_059547 [Portunus trituberculatus]|uniref:Uncharacterized protein n=1 Tax=Portunus trituberculatus TaxID=210409 RepID=A0A5B7H5N0_PORTR|nr:hypothetical protein [Portunus trituberculatus]
MEVVCINIDNNQLLRFGPRSARDRGGEPANHSEVATFSPSPGKFKPRKFTKMDVIVLYYVVVVVKQG